MKQFVFPLLKKPIFFVLIIILIVYLPIGISKAPEGVDRQYISTIGIDTSAEGFEVSVLSHASIPAEKYTLNYILSSASAPTIPFALFKISEITGKKVALTHTTTIAVSQQIAQQGLHKTLDFFYRNENIGNDAQIVCVLGSVKDFLNFEKDRVNSAGFTLEEVLQYNSKNTFFTDNNLESFYKGIFSNTQTSTTAVAELTANPNSEQLLQTGENTPTAPKKEKILSLGKLGIYKQGALKSILSEEEVFGFNLVNGKTQNIYLSIDNFSDQNFDNVNLILNIDKNKVSKNVSFQNGKPVAQINTFLSLSIESVESATPQKEYFSHNKNFLSEELKTAIQNKTKEKFSAFLDQIKLANADILGISAIFENTFPKQFSSWKENLEDPENFLSLIEFRMTVASALTQ